jgi:hypothetical protein
MDYYETRFSQFGGILTGAGLLLGATVWITITYPEGTFYRDESRIVDGAGKLNAQYSYQRCGGIYSSMLYEALDRDGNPISTSPPLPLAELNRRCDVDAGCILDTCQRSPC